MGSIHRLFKAAALACMTVPAFSFSLMAAPQILAVASTAIDAKMHCFDGKCSAELSSICLQENRSTPYAMTEYFIHGGKKLILTGHQADGRTVTLSDLPLTIVSARGHKAIRVSFPESLIKSAKPMMVSISVPENITVIPIAVTGDNKPQTDFDIALAAGPWRQAATSIVDKNRNNKPAAELINHAINALPVRGRADPKIRDHAKAQFISVVGESKFSPEVKETAIKIVRSCHANTTVGLQNYRQCLGNQHDLLIGELNTKFWDATKTGS